MPATALPSGLKEAVEIFFSTHIYSGYRQPFQLHDIQPSEFNRSILIAVPYDVDEEIDDSDQDREWERQLAEIGKRFGVPLMLPHWCYAI